MKNILIFYPWEAETIIEGKNGAGVRVNYLIKFLKGYGYNVRVISLSVKNRVLYYDDILFEQVRIPNNFIYFMFISFIKLISIAFNLKSIKALSYYFSYKFDKRFVNNIIKHTKDNNIDAVILEYPFYHRYLDKAGIPYVLTNHDIICSSWTPLKIEKVLLEKLLLKYEKDAIKSAFDVFLVSRNDLEFFDNIVKRNYNLVENPPKITDIKTTDLIINKLNLKNKNIILFVGSNWYPNIEAAIFIANNLAPKLKDLIFVIVGDCGAKIKFKTDNVIITGRVTDDELAELYHHSKLVLIPLIHGTGSSIKTIEAIGLGKMVLTTSVGVRGIDNINYKLVRVEDDFEKYPEIIMQLVNQNLIGSHSNFDYDSKFSLYVKSINEYIKKFNLRDLS